MIRLICSDLLHNARIWAGVCVVTIVAGFVGAYAAALIDTSIHSSESVQQTLAGGSTAVIMFTSITALIVLSSMSNLTVSLQQRGYALWQLVGVRPARIGRVVLAQLALVSVVGALAGVALALPALQPISAAIFVRWENVRGVHIGFSPIGALCVVVAVLAVVIVGGLRGARRASRVAPIVALREPEPPSMRAGWFRMLLAAATLAGIVALATSIYGGDFDLIVNASVFLTPLIVTFFAVLGPIVFPVALRVWTALVPGRVSAPWFLARHSAGYRVSQSTAAISPLMVAIALAGGLYSTVSLLRQAVIERTGDDGGWGLDFDSAVLMLGGPLLLSGVAAAATVYMTSHAREREFALMMAAGATQPSIVAMAVWEALIYAVTATLLGLVAILAGSIIVATALGLHSMPLAWASTALIAAGGLILLLVATVVPTAVALKHEVPRTLAVD